MPFASALNELLPSDVPHRSSLIERTALHLQRIEEANRQFNLTRITGERDAVIKHVVDSLAPWTLFRGARHVADAGTGAGFPGIPLALALPETKFTLLESTGKKARFVEAVVAELGLANATVAGDRAETWLASHKPDVVTARAVAPIPKALELFAPAIRAGARVLLYKGPDAETEIAEARPDLQRRRMSARICFRYELPEQAGSRTVVELARR